MIPHVVLSCVPTRKDGIPEFVMSCSGTGVAIPLVKLQVRSFH